MSAGVVEHWLLLRGLGREQGHWGEFPERMHLAFAAQGRQLSLTMMDLPGNGQRWMEPSPCDVAGMVAACRETLGAKPTPRRVLALSLAGMVCVEWAKRHPQELSGLVLINTSMRPFSPFHHRLRPAQYGRLLGLPWMGRREREQAVLHMTTHLQHDPEVVLAWWEALARRHPVRTVNLLRQLWAAARFRAPAEVPQVPMLILASSRDAMVDVRCSRALAAAWRLPLIEHPQAGHDLPLDDPDWLVQRLLAWG